MRKTFANALMSMAEKDSRIWLLTPDVGFSVLEGFAEKFPDRFLNVGIAEQNAVGIAAGLALSGKIPYVYTMAPFACERTFEQVKIDAAYMNSNVRIVGIGAGFSYGPAGATHHAIEDIAIMRSLPNMAVVAPGDLSETKALVRYSVVHSGPMYIRLGKNGEPEYEHDVEFGKISEVIKGGSCAVISTSTMLEDCYDACLELKSEGIDAMCLSAHTLKPFDEERIVDLVSRGIPIVTVEEHNVIGGLYSAVSETAVRTGRGVRILPIAVPDAFSHFVGSQKHIRSRMGLGCLSVRIADFMRSIAVGSV